MTTPFWWCAWQVQNTTSRHACLKFAAKTAEILSQPHFPWSLPTSCATFLLFIQWITHRMWQDQNLSPFDYMVSFISCTCHPTTALAQLSAALQPGLLQTGRQHSSSPEQTRAGGGSWNTASRVGPTHLREEAARKAWWIWGFILKEETETLQGHFQSSMHIHALSQKFLTPTKILLASQIRRGEK